jgi:general secretion pathway protein M
MIERLDPRQQRLLAIAILAIALVAAASIIVVPVWSATASYNEQIDSAQHRLHTLRRIAASDGKLRPRFEQIRTAQVSSGHYLRSATDAVAAAELQRILKSLAGSNGVQVQSTQILPAGAADEFVRVALRVRLRGSLPGFVDTLHEIESNEVYLFVDNLSISNVVDRRRIVQESSAEFDVTLDLITYLPGES